jgi:hypothetical protein
MKPGSMLAFIVFLAVAVAHAVRVVAGLEIVVDGSTIPMWVSYVGVVVPAYIAWMLWREREPGAA